MDSKHTAVEITDVSTIGDRDQPGDIVLADKVPNVTVLSLCIQNGVKHVVQRSNISSVYELGFSSLATSSPETFFEFPLSCIFGRSQPNATTEREISKISILVGTMSEIKSILGLYENLVKHLTSSPALLNDILMTVDEVFSNAVFNGPYPNAIHQPASREVENVYIDPDKKPHLFAGFDEDRIVIGCQDYYGTLDATKLMSRIKYCYEANASNAINFGMGGAGIGSFLMFNSCVSMYLGVDRGQSTTVCCSFPLRLNATQRGDIPKNIHLILR